MNIALVAHDKMKDTMIGFCIAYEYILKQYGLYATGTTGKKIEEATELDINILASGPLGGDQQIGSLIVSQDIDLIIFFIRQKEVLVLFKNINTSKYFFINYYQLFFLLYINVLLLLCFV